MAHVEDANLSRWWEQHSELDRLVDELMEVTARGDTGAALPALERFADALQLHLREEESVAFPLIERLSPEHAGRVRRAREAHVGLRADLDTALSHLDRGDLAAARRAIEDLLGRFRRHEEGEAWLVEELERAAAGCPA